MKKMLACLGFAAVAALALALPNEAEGQKGKKPPPPKILNENLNNLLTFRRTCYDRAVKLYDKQNAGGTPALNKVMTEYQNRMQHINNFANTANQLVQFQFRGIVTLNVPPAVGLSTVGSNTDSVSFAQPQNALFLPLAGEKVAIEGFYSPQANLTAFPQFVDAFGNITPIQGVQIGLNSVKKIK